MNLKIMTLNAHSLHGDNAEENIEWLCELLADELPDVVALQEVNQSESAELADTDHSDPFCRAVTCTHPVPFKRDNFVLELVWRMARRGVVYHFCWLPVKLGYSKYDEGLAFLCRSPIRTACGFYVSKSESYEAWRTRMALLIELKEQDLMLCNVHLSRYDDEADPFYDQWRRLCEKLPENRRMLLMGDFNCPAEVRGEGYDRVCESGYFDMYRLADVREGERPTTVGEIDGWRDGKAPAGGGRIDLIFSGFYPKAKKISYRRVLDGERGRVVSDHFGVIVDIEGMEQELK